ncbi:MAG: radical SAM protein [Actinomycetota bacterium]|nr:radical SAM protein [Actinomycetota bacterium]
MTPTLRERLRRFELATRPVHPDTEAALRRRWDELPDHVKHEGQALGRRSTGCEGTHGVFPRCNLACTPCYHSRDANRVRVDADHTIREIDEQMAMLRRERGPGQYAQLIGGEVTLLPPEDHAQALLTMRKHGRKPMSMSHGDFDYDYLERLACNPDGSPRFTSMSFAGHFDSMMYGRRGIKHVKDERELNPHRERFCQMFQRLEREHGVKSYLAHNMTVTPRNVGQLAQVIADCRHMGFRMFSFQPAAFIGNTNRWKDDYEDVSGDRVWAEMERGAGGHLAWNVFQIGDERCNRSAYGAFVGDRYVQLIDDRGPGDFEVRDALYESFGGMDFEAPHLAVKLLRVCARHPRTVPVALRWLGRFVRRARPGPLLRHGVKPVTFVMHSFMDAKDVRPAWAALQRGEISDDPRIRATQERLQACSYAMAHPESDTLVPACAQHSVLDPQENLELMKLLPLLEPHEVAVPAAAGPASG